MWAIVPLKSLESAKQRLAPHLTAEERRALMLAMARDVLTALCGARELTGILLTSRSPEADALARAFNTERFAESPDADLPQALEQATAHLATNYGAPGIMVVPADVPLITPAEVDALVAAHDRAAGSDGRAVTVIPDAENLGTNALLLTPPDVIGFVFNGQSFKPHVDAAYRLGLNPRVAPSRGFALDIDTEADLRTLLDSNPTTQTGAFLEKWGIARRLARPVADPSRSERTDH